MVKDLKAAIKFYEKLGAKVRCCKSVRYLGAIAAKVKFKNNKLLLLEEKGPGIVADFASERGEGILGMSVKMKNLFKARRYIERKTGFDLDIFFYRWRFRFLIPRSYTNGFLIEMVQ